MTETNTQTVAREMILTRLESCKKLAKQSKLHFAFDFVRGLWDPVWQENVFSDKTAQRTFLRVHFASYLTTFFDEKITRPVHYR
jgi:hypothetical protein